MENFSSLLSSMKGIILSVFVLLGIIPCLAQKSTKDENEIKQLIKNYKLSINNADTLMGKKVWLNASEISFIHPKGHEKGWKAIKNNFYGMFRTMFKTRDLKSNNEVINIYKDVAWVEFYWVFDAHFADDLPLQTKGRETQILKKVNNQWRIVHVHYSGMPVTGERQGF